jgi:hypothetical protein
MNFPDLSDNGSYLIMGILAFWLPTLGYWFWMRVRATRATEEEALLREELKRK